MNQPASTQSNRRRARHYRSPAKLWGVLLLFLAQWGSFGAAVWCGWNYYQKIDSSYWGQMLLVSGVAYVVILIVRYAFCQRVMCPLCHGPMFGYRACQKHPTAKKIPILGYRVKSVLEMLFTGIWRCMFCGTLYRRRR